MKRKLLLLMLIPLLGLLSLKAQTCIHSVELVDSYGDGWNGGTLTIMVNGSAVLTNITLGLGAGPGVYYFDAATGDDIDADYTAGSYGYENEYTVKDGGGSILGQSGQGGAEPVDVLNMVGNCPACPPPTGQTETNITTTSADLGWTTGGSGTWDIEWGVSGFTQGTGTVITGTTNNPYSLSGLTAGELYDWYVRDDCGGDQSDWTGPHTFAAACNAVTTFPYTESFEGTWVGIPTAPICWSQITVSGTNAWSQHATSPHGGTYCAIAPWASDGGEHLLITPGFDFGTSDYRLRFWLKGSSSIGTDLQVQIADNNSAASNFTTELAYYVAGTNMPTTWTEYIIDLSAYENTHYIAFRMIDNDGYSLYIDDVTIEEIQALPPDPATNPFPFNGLT
ncbi:MAG: choice-of-anchor J domain-containing protein, partial [Bacteroidales bacterium]